MHSKIMYLVFTSLLLQSDFAAAMENKDQELCQRTVTPAVKQDELMSLETPPYNNYPSNVYRENETDCIYCCCTCSCAVTGLFLAGLYKLIYR